MLFSCLFRAHPPFIAFSLSSLPSFFSPLFSSYPREKKCLSHPLMGLCYFRRKHTHTHTEAHEKMDTGSRGSTFDSTETVDLQTGRNSPAPWVVHMNSTSSPVSRVLLFPPTVSPADVHEFISESVKPTIRQGARENDRHGKKEREGEKKMWETTLVKKVRDKSEIHRLDYSSASASELVPGARRNGFS